MALRRMPRGTTTLVKRIPGFSSPKASSDYDAQLMRSTSSFSGLTEDDRLAILTGRRSKSMRKASKFGRLPGDIPQGCLAVYVGSDRRRYVISTNFLAHSLFKELLKKSEEEFGFQYEGGLNIACEPSFFEHLLWLIITKDPTARRIRLDELVDSFENRF